MDAFEKLPKDEESLDKLIEDIANGKAVLLIGQEIFPGGWHDKLNEYLKKKFKDDFYYNQKDGLFFFKNDLKLEAQEETINFFEELQKDDEIYKKIIEIPFKIMISANPDKYLVNAFDSCFFEPHIDLQFDYLKFTEAGPEYEGKYQISEPEVNKPLLYNLLGSVEDESSLVLEYSDLFNLVKTLLQDKIPVSLRNPLRNIKTYIIIGFKFEIWYNQFFIKYLQNLKNEDISRSYVLNTNLDDDKDSIDYLVNLFKIKYVGLDTDGFIKLHKRFKAKYNDKIRKVNHSSSFSEKILKLLNIDDYISIFKNFGNIDFDCLEDSEILAQIQQQYNSYIDHKFYKSAPQADLDEMIANIRNQIIELSKKYNSI
jgi:hypothetical protein